VFGSPAVSRDTVYAVTLGGTLWQIPLAGPGGARARNLGTAVRASPTPFAGGLLIGTVEGEILWLAPLELEPRWRRQFRGPIEEPPLVEDGVLFILDGEGKLHAWGAPVAEQ
jgi:outer membrane protein assembly factor BamB